MLLRKIKNSLINIPGWRTNRKIVVIESDDWGSIRTVSPDRYISFFMSFGSFNNPYLRYDTLASEDDLNALYEVLCLFQDFQGNYPVITFNTVVANPDFKKIKDSRFLEFYYEPFTDTLKRYYPNEDVFNTWKQGISERLILPQFHGREHLNVPVWLDLLQSANLELLKAFEFETWSIPEGKYPASRVKLQAALDYIGKHPVNYQEGFITKGLDLFENIFGFRSESMIANNFVMPTNLHLLIKQSGVKVLQGMKYQVLPYANNNNRKYIRRYFGQKDNNGMYFNVRNCTFEPSQTKDNYDDVGSCLKQIQNAFFWKKPAVITTHRLNFIGSLNENNRKINLDKFERLLSGIKRKWPDVEFLSSDKLVPELKQ